MMRGRMEGVGFMETKVPAGLTGSVSMRHGGDGHVKGRGGGNGEEGEKMN